MATPTLNLLVQPSYNPYTLVVADLSTYPADFNILAPTLQVAPPGFPTVAFVFTARAITVLNSETMGITRSGTDLVRLPDGLYRLKYTVAPAYQHSVEKTFFRIDALQERFDTLFLQADLSGGDRHFSRRQLEALREIETLMHELTAAANQCAVNLAQNLYRLAASAVDRFQTQSTCC